MNRRAVITTRPAGATASVWPMDGMAPAGNRRLLPTPVLHSSSRRPRPTGRGAINFDNSTEPPKPEAPTDLDKLAGQPADLSPWAYAWRADRQVQEKPERYFIPRRLARATPRAWLDQGKKINVKNAPTCFGALAYEIVSDVDNGKINATVEMPSRKAPKEVVLRFRHPKAAPIKAVTVNGPSATSTGSGQAGSTGSPQAGSGQGKPWTEFNKDKETITLKGLTGTVAVTAQY